MRLPDKLSGHCKKNETKKTSALNLKNHLALVTCTSQKHPYHAERLSVTISFKESPKLYPT